MKNKGYANFFFWGGDKVRYGKCGSGVLPLGCATGRPCNNRRLEHVHHANLVVFFRWKSWSCMCFDNRNNLRLWSSPNNKAVGFMDETFGFVEETVAFWDNSLCFKILPYRKWPNKRPPLNKRFVSNKFSSLRCWHCLRQPSLINAPCLIDTLYENFSSSLLD